MDLGLQGKRALVTGGSRGMGREIVLGLARAGARVAACYRNPGEAVDSLAKELAELGGDNLLIQADVSADGAAARLVEQAAARLGGFDVLVNNAGAISHVPYAELGVDEWNRVVATNLTATHLVIQQALPHLAKGASVVNIGSAVATVGLPLRAHYTASKAALIGLSRTLAKELGPRGIRVNLVAPGVIETDQAAGLSAQQRERYRAMISLGRLGDPADVAGVVLFLAGDLARYVTGTTLTVDGGI